MRRAMPLIFLGREETRREHLGGSTILAMCFAAPISNRETVVNRPKPLDASIAGIDRHDESHVGRPGIRLRVPHRASADP
jgi:hypothetical protein